MAASYEQTSLVHSPPPRLIPQLPDEISIQCIARVPRFFHPTLALVSRSWCSLLNSSLLFTVRSDLGVSKHFICINTFPNRFYLLDLLHPQNPSPALRLPPSPIPSYGPSCVAIGHTLFVLGGHSPSPSSSSATRDVQIFDTRLNRWSIGPQMRVPRHRHAVWVIGDKIYVASGCDSKSDSWAEVLDLQLGVWTTLAIPAHIQEKLGVFTRFAVLGGKLLSGGGVMFDPEVEPAWSDMPTEIHHRWRGRAAVVDEVLYAFDSMGKIWGYNLTAGKWKPLEGWDKKLPDLKRTWLGNVSGILCVIWEERWGDSYERKKMVVGIKVARKSCGGLMGSIVWSEFALPILLQESCVTDFMALEF